MAVSKPGTYTEFHQTTLNLLKLLISLSEEQLNLQPKQGWSAAQVCEHILKSYASVETLNGSTSETLRPIDQKLDSVRSLFLDTSIKMDSPTEILPSTERISKKKLVNGLENRIAQIKEVIQNKDLSLTCVDFAIPEYGEFTRFEWIWFNIYHTQRHIFQLKNIVSANNLKSNH